jgi:hypothetical protein
VGHHTYNLDDNGDAAAARQKEKDECLQRTKMFTTIFVENYGYVDDEPKGRATGAAFMSPSHNTFEFIVPDTLLLICGALDFFKSSLFAVTSFHSREHRLAALKSVIPI